MSGRLKGTMRRFKLPYTVMAVVISTLNACAFKEMKWADSWFQESETTSSAYFVGVSGLKLWREPSAGSELITRLNLHEKVVRSKLDNGYAFVTVVQTGETGWVDNAKLIWKLPVKTEQSPSKTMTQKPEIKEQTISTEIDAAEDKPEPKKPDVEPVSEPDTVAPSSFNPF